MSLDSGACEGLNSKSQPRVELPGRTDSRSCGNDESLGITSCKGMKSCRACGSSNTGLLFEIEERRVRRCSECTHALESVNFEANSENFVFDNEILVQFVIKNMRFKEIPVSTRYSFDSSSVSFKAGVVYGLSILRTIIKYLLFKWGFVKYKQFN